MHQYLTAKHFCIYSKFRDATIMLFSAFWRNSESASDHCCLRHRMMISVLSLDCICVVPDIFDVQLRVSHP